MENSDTQELELKEKEISVSMLSHPSESSRASTSIDDEGTFIPLAAKDSEWNGPKFLNPKFIELEYDDEVVQIVDLEATVDTKQPLLLLFPDLECDKNAVKALSATMSTTELTKMLVGKKADFSFLKPSRKFTNNLHQSDKLSPVEEDEGCQE